MVPRPRTNTILYRGVLAPVSNDNVVMASLAEQGLAPCCWYALSVVDEGTPQ